MKPARMLGGLALLLTVLLLALPAACWALDLDAAQLAVGGRLLWAECFPRDAKNIEIRRPYDAYGAFDGGFLIARQAEITLLDRNGDAVLSHVAPLSVPAVLSGPSCAVAYCRGGRDFYVFDRFGLRGGGEAPFSILGGAACRDGFFLFGEGIAAAYSHTGRPGPVVACDGTPQAALQTDLGYFLATDREIRLLDERGRTVARHATAGLLALGIDADGTPLLVTRESIVSYTAGGFSEVRHSRAGTHAAVTRDGIFLISEEFTESSQISQKTSLLLIDRSGKLLYNSSAPESPRAVLAREREICLLYAEGVLRADRDGPAWGEISDPSAARGLLDSPLGIYIVYDEYWQRPVWSQSAE